MCKNCKKSYYITTAIAYTSGKPHIGNSYEIVLADSIARFKREQGFDVRFQTGTDEHGQKIEEKAKAAGITPQAFVDRVAEEIQRIWDLMNTSYDKFIRTTDKDHEAQVQKIFKKLYDQGDIYKGYYEGMYCTPCESFFTESQVVILKYYQELKVGEIARLMDISRSSVNRYLSSGKTHLEKILRQGGEFAL